MQYYSSMSLADYIAANWQELPKELVEMFERESDRYLDQSEEIQNLREMLYDFEHDAEQFRKSIEDCVDEYCFAKIPVGDFITDLRSLCTDYEF